MIVFVVAHNINYMGKVVATIIKEIMDTPTLFRASTSMTIFQVRTIHF
jgi:hypothetical protein